MQTVPGTASFESTAQNRYQYIQLRSVWTTSGEDAI